MKSESHKYESYRGRIPIDLEEEYQNAIKIGDRERIKNIVDRAAYISGYLSPVGIPYEATYEGAVSWFESNGNPLEDYRIDITRSNNIVYVGRSDPPFKYYEIAVLFPKSMRRYDTGEEITDYLFDEYMNKMNSKGVVYRIYFDDEFPERVETFKLPHDNDLVNFYGERKAMPLRMRFP